MNLDIAREWFLEPRRWRRSRETFDRVGLSAVDQVGYDALYR